MVEGMTKGLQHTHTHTRTAYTYHSHTHTHTHTGIEEQNTTRRVLVVVVEGRRQGGRLKLRWEDGVTDDARTLGERNWKNTARNRGRSFWRRPWLKKGRCANDDDDDDEICILEIRSTHTTTETVLVDNTGKKSMLSRGRLNTLCSHLLV